jgi:hypothetical protein
MPECGSVTDQLAFNVVRLEVYSPSSFTVGAAGGDESTVIPSELPTALHIPAPFFALTAKKYFVPSTKARPDFVTSVSVPTDVQSTTLVLPALVPIAY